MATIEVKVPDIGDFKDVPVIEVHVKPGDVIKAEDTLITLESDKATMDVPSPTAGTVKEVKIKVGDKVAEGMLVLVLEAGAEKVGAGETAKPAAAAAARPLPPRRAPNTHAPAAAGSCNPPAQSRCSPQCPPA